jgi:dolichol-phosphate mannosyltransferase
MSPRIDLSVVIPAYREEENLRHLLPRLQGVLATLGLAAETLIVDTVTPLDGARVVCREYGAVCVPRKGGNSYGDAVRTGIALARGEWILFMDADGSHSPEFIPLLVRNARDGDYDIVIASRYIAGGRTDNPPLLIWMSHVLNFIYGAVLHIRCNDVSNSFKIYRADVLQGLSLRCNNFDIVEEILVRYTLKKKDTRIKEIPFTFKKRAFGQTKRNLLAFVASFAFTLLKLLLIKVRG